MVRCNRDLSLAGWLPILTTFLFDTLYCEAQYILNSILHTISVPVFYDNILYIFISMCVVLA